jgi:carotenoid cleavage dioxygenase-like enzyme
MNAPVRISPYLTGNFAPVRSEDTYQDVPIVGSIPDALCGTFYRTGPNPQFEPRDANYHWFSGDGMVHAFRVADGRVSYFNRYVRTPKWQAEHEAQRSLFGTFGNPMTTDPAYVGKESGVANTNILWHAGRLLALEEGHQPFEVDPKDLSPRGYLDYAGLAKRFTAHPKIDPETGELVFFGYMAGDIPLGRGMAYGVVDKSGTVTRLDRFEAPFASMVHDFLVTKNHVLFPILPLTGSLDRAMRGGPPFAWEPEKGSHIGVLARNAGIETIRWFTTGPCYVFHPMNAWEADGKIYAHVMQYEQAPLFPNADGSIGNGDANARLALWTFDLNSNSNTVRREYVDDLPGEFPRLDERRAGLAYRHGYFAANVREERGISLDAIAHIDHKTGKRVQCDFAEGDTPGEPVFVPRKATSPEGEGWLVTVVYRGAEDRSDFVVLDAEDVKAGPIAIAQLPRRVPFGFHGNWVGATA